MSPVRTETDHVTEQTERIDPNVYQSQLDLDPNIIQTSHYPGHTMWTHLNALMI